MKVIIDSLMTREAALRQNPESSCPEDVLRQQFVLTVSHYGFDELLHFGQIVVHKDLAADVADLFLEIRHRRFPIESVIPISDPLFARDDEVSMATNNCSGFNYRLIVGTTRLSQHAHGRAIDINPFQNPIIRSGIYVSPLGAVYDPSLAGTLTSDCFVVWFLKNRGWIWGGDWDEPKDYHHFHKLAD